MTHEHKQNDFAKCQVLRSCFSQLDLIVLLMRFGSLYPNHRFATMLDHYQKTDLPEAI